MKQKLINSQLSNYTAYEMKKRQMLSLAENVFQFPNMPKFIDLSYVNGCLLRQGSIAFFVDEIMGLLALPYTVLGSLDVYNRPRSIIVNGLNGYTRAIKSSDDFVIMYDNNGRYPIYLDIIQYAERLAIDLRTCDINIDQQKTPRFWKTSSEKEKSVRDLVNEVDGFVNTVITYKDMDLDDTDIVLAPAPFVADKVSDHYSKIWNEFLCLVGIANTNFQKKERNIKDEILMSQGGTIANRFSRFEPRQKAIEEINEKFGTRTLLDGTPVLKKKLEVRFYDGIPNSYIDVIKNIDENNENEVIDNDTNL